MHYQKAREAMSKLIGSGRLGGYEHTQEYIFLEKYENVLVKVIHIC